MARLIGYFANQRDRFGCALEAERAALSLDVPTSTDGWGVGSYQSGEVLLRKKPAEVRDSVDVRAITKDLKTDCAILHLRAATVGPRTLDNTHPFRYRQWLFAHTGSITGLAHVAPRMRAEIPDFLERNIRGETDSELLFHFVLGALHRAGRIDDPEADRMTVVQALRDTIPTLDAWCAEAGGGRSTLNLVITNGLAMVALCHGLPMAWCRRQGIRDCEACRQPPEIAGRDPRRVDHDAFKYVIVASDHSTVPRGWLEAPDESGGVALAIDRSLDVEAVPLSAP